jgi:hypothetical protein
LGTAARTAVVAETATAVSDRASQRQPAPQPEREGSGSDDVIFQLRELVQLREQGVLTEEEFAVQKSRLLNR